MDLVDVDAGSTNAIAGNVWNDRNDRFRRIQAIYAGSGISIGNSGSSVTISNSRPPETIRMVISDVVSGSQGYYRAKRIQQAADPQAGAIAASDFGVPDTTYDLIFGNAAELIGAPPLRTDGTCVVVGQACGYNLVSDGGVGGSGEDGLLVVVGLAYTSPLFPVALTQTGGSTSTGYTYTVKDLSGNTLGTAIAPAFRMFAPSSINILAAATTGTGYFNASNDFVLKSADETWKITAC